MANIKEKIGENLDKTSILCYTNLLLQNGQIVPNSAFVLAIMSECTLKILMLLA